MIAYVIGSISQHKEIEEFADSILNKYDEVYFVKPQPDEYKANLISKCFDNIIKSDDIYVITKPDGSIGDGTLYEIEYADRLEKNIEIIQYHNK